MKYQRIVYMATIIGRVMGIYPGKGKGGGREHLTDIGGYYSVVQ